MQKSFSKIILALDTTDKSKIHHLLDELQDYIDIVKVGFQSFIHFGHDIVRMVQDKGYKVFLDMKLHDIPNTVEKAVEAASKLNVYMLTVHTLGGQEMLKKAVSISKQINGPLILGVTVLTSMDDNSLKEIKISEKTDSLVPYLARYGKHAGIDGVISSPHEIEKIRQACGNDFLIVTPGIRFKSGIDDQKRTMTPKDALNKGANFIVVGRPILEAENPISFFENLRL